MKIVTFGETMLRLSPPGALRFGQARRLDATFGGAESNVAAALARWGVSTAFVTRLPSNGLADACLAELRQHGVDTSRTVRGGERMGVYFLEHGAGLRGGKVTYDRAHSGMATLQPGMIDWEKALEGADWLHWSGITPALSASAAAACAEAVEAAQRLGLTVSVDLNLRKNLWQWGKPPAEVMPDLVKSCRVIVANEESASLYFGIADPAANGLDDGEASLPAYSRLCEKMMERFPACRQVAFTLRRTRSASHNDVGGLLFDGESLRQSPVFSIPQIVDRVGSGDAFTAGLVFGLAKNWDSQRTVDFAAAASALKHSIFGDLLLAGQDEVEALLAGAAGRLRR